MKNALKITNKGARDYFRLHAALFFAVINSSLSVSLFATFPVTFECRDVITAWLAWPFMSTSAAGYAGAFDTTSDKIVIDEIKWIINATRKTRDNAGENVCRVNPTNCTILYNRVVCIFMLCCHWHGNARWQVRAHQNGNNVSEATLDSARYARTEM